MYCVQCGTQTLMSDQFCSECGAPQNSISANRVPIPPKLRFAVLERDSFKCVYCGRGGENLQLQIDHVIPVSAGGTNELNNLVTSCADCNQGKGKKKLTSLATTDSRKWQHIDQVLHAQQRELLSRHSAYLDEYLEVSLRFMRQTLHQLKLRRAELETAIQMQDQWKLESFFSVGTLIDVEREIVLGENEVDALKVEQERDFRKLLRSKIDQINEVKDQYFWSEEEEASLQTLTTEFLLRVDSINKEHEDRINNEISARFTELTDKIVAVSDSLRDRLKDAVPPPGDQLRNQRLDRRVGQIVEPESPERATTESPVNVTSDSSSSSSQQPWWRKIMPS